MHAPFGAASLRDIKRAAEGVCCPVLLIRDEVAAEQPGLVALARRLFETVVVADGSESTLVRQCRLDGVTTFHDAELDLVDRVLASAGLPGRTGVDHAWDKLVQRSTLREHGLTSVRARGVDSREDLAAAVAELGRPGVLKPRRANTGTSLAMIDTADDFRHQMTARAAWRGLLYETRIPDGAHPSGVGWLGDFVSVETINTDRHRHVAVVDKLGPSLVKHCGADGADSLNEVGDLVPSRLPGDMLAEVLDYTSRCLDALGVTWRVTHSEVKLTPTGPELIEVNGRTAGYLSRLVGLAHGPDLIRAALGLAVGRSPAEPLDGLSGSALLLLPAFPDRRGAVLSDVSAADLLRLPGVVGVDEVASAGDPRSRNGFRMAVLNLVADSFDEISAGREATLDGINRLFARDLSAGLNRSHADAGHGGSQ
ncbi:hypothetical protein [Dactylosporangium sp. NPDC005555]|uniref:ATP-grasp domain-containing protein n=1 Tax=Dactylosporangium sp. NPDC005555 TaxID=3154889 RepID=UPI0033AFE4B7